MSLGAKQVFIRYSLQDITLQDLCKIFKVTLCKIYLPYLPAKYMGSSIVLLNVIDADRTDANIRSGHHVRNFDWVGSRVCR